MRAAPPPLADLLTQIRRSGLDTDKEPSYLESYEEFFAPVRFEPIHFLEIGVREGGSLALWHAYFPAGHIHGLDQNAATSSEFESYAESHRLSDRVSLHLGVKVPPHTVPLADRLALFEDCFGDTRFDIILDDGAHTYTHSKAAFEPLFETFLKPGGIYIFEDWGTTYFPEWPDGSVDGHEGMFRLIGELSDEVALRDRRRDRPSVTPAVHTVLVRFGQIWVFKTRGPFAT